MAKGTLHGTATVVSAHENAPQSSNDGESTLIDLFTDRFDSWSYELKLDVQPEGGAAYRVSGEYRMPSRVHAIRKSLSGPPKLTPGVVLPVAIDASDPQKVEILWKELIRSGGTSQLYGESFSAKSLVADIRDAVTARTDPGPPANEPSSPRPTAERFPPIEGVDFDTYIAAVLPLTRGGVAAADVVAHYEASGFPVGRVPQVAQAWAERTAATPELDEWYRYLTQT